MRFLQRPDLKQKTWAPKNTNELPELPAHSQGKALWTYQDEALLTNQDEALPPLPLLVYWT